MSDILNNIVAKRKQTVAQLKMVVPIGAWEMMPLFTKKTISLKEALANEDSTGIIAEFKRASPSKGIINDSANIFDVIDSYEKYGASGVSILTEPIFFNGNNDDILSVAGSLKVPILRKDFIFDEYQLLESKALGADVILLIAASLSPKQVKKLAGYAKNINLEVLLEVHNEEELQHICDEVDIVGVNNRNLKTFKVDINTSLQLFDKIPTGKIIITESGISNAETIVTLKQAGFKGFLIGETFMKESDPGKAFKNFVTGLNPV
ncbi:MAG: indole-3-glycerol phosphate synthase TrpC [Bacteroidia bacterium]|nr:indole-3-glycerol phosphate synthase TrpC [Bacteroidia bacterium]